MILWLSEFNRARWRQGQCQQSHKPKVRCQEGSPGKAWLTGSKGSLRSVQLISLELASADTFVSSWTRTGNLLPSCNLYRLQCLTIGCPNTICSRLGKRWHPAMSAIYTEKYSIVTRSTDTKVKLGLGWGVSPIAQRLRCGLLPLVLLPCYESLFLCLTWAEVWLELIGEQYLDVFSCPYSYCARKNAWMTNGGARKKRAKKAPLLGRIIAYQQ